MPDRGDRALLDFIQEPVFVLTPSGTVLQSNAASERVIGRGWAGQNLSEWLVSPRDDFFSWLKRCSGTTAPLIGLLELRNPDGTVQRFRAHGARLRDSGGQTRIAVRCSRVETDKFSILKKRVEQLNAEARERQRKQAVLEEALRQNEILLRELNHRVKNNIQLLVGLLSVAMSETESTEAKELLQTLSNRVLAVGAAQDLMYESQQTTTISTAPFIGALATAISASLGSQVQLDISAAEGKLSNDAAFPLALILNELVINAYKHGLSGGEGRIGIALERRGDEYSLIVHDNGPGIVADDQLRRSSGLSLVRGLCRQLGAELLLENADGAKCTVRFTHCPDEEID